MKVSAAVLAFCAEIALAAPQSGGIGALISSLGNKGYGKVPAPPGSAKGKEVTDSPLKVPGVPNIKRVKIRAGPYKVPDMGTKSITGHAGMLESYYDSAIEKPCAGDCVILRQQGGLEYVNGSNANIDTGMWLHHMVHFNAGPGRWDPVAYNNAICLPHTGFGSSPKRSERYFVTGNEREPFHYYNEASGLKSAYQLKAADKFTYLIELMNMNMSPQTVFLTMTYDIIDGSLPAGFSDTKTVFLDAASCGTSEVKPPKQDGAFTIQSKPWKPNVEGKIVFGLGHLHDGGTDIDLSAGTNQLLCKSKAKYSEKPEYVFRGMAMAGEKVAKDHISSMANCQPSNFGVKMMSRAQSWVARGYYDYSAKEGNLEGGKQSDIMAIAIVLVAVPGGTQPVV